MVKRNKGHIVEIASMSSFVSVGQFSSYSATKLALVAFTESKSLHTTLIGLREQLRTWYRAPDVHVTIVHPHWVATPLVAERQDLIEKKAGKMMTAEKVGREIAEQVFRCRGAQLVIPGGFSFLRTTRAWPAWLLDLLKGLQATSREEIEKATKQL
jgi:short-subunit dehydrogenase